MPISRLRIALLILLLAMAAVATLHSGKALDGHRTASGQSDQEPWPTAETQGQLAHDGILRTYYVYTPSSYDGSRVVPLVIALHGGHGDGRRMAQASRLNEVAEREGFITVYPEAAADKHWNDGRSTTTAGPDDVAFITVLIDHLQRSRSIDPRRIYSVGTSNGGMLVHRLACELSNRIAAFAAVIASLPADLRPRCKPAQPLPILMINGVDDPLMPWSGGAIRKGRHLGKGGQVLSVPDSVDFWARHNRCSPTPEVTNLPDINPNDGTRAQRIRYVRCQKSSEVVLFQIQGGGHTWPGSPVTPLLPIVGKMSQDINATEVIWEFFGRHALPPVQDSRSSDVPRGPFGFARRDTPAPRYSPHMTTSRAAGAESTDRLWAGTRALPRHPDTLRLNGFLG